MVEALRTVVVSKNADASVTISTDGYPIMKFHNEYVPKIEDETSDVLKAVCKKLHMGLDSTDKWTVESNREMVLIKTGRGHDIDSQNEEYWSFFEGTSEYRFMTKLLQRREISSKHVYLERSIRFMMGFDFSEPNDAVLKRIKDALIAHKDFGVISRFDTCELVLVDANGEVI